MKYYISIDGGGSKIEAVVFDENLNMLSAATSGSVNPNFSTKEVIRRNLKLCFDHLFRNLDVREVECLYVAFVGEVDKMVEFLRKYAAVNKVCHVGEYELGMYSSGIFDGAVVALSGTGSGVFYVQEKDPHNQEFWAQPGLGGWGAIISEEGSGYYLGRMAAMAAIHDYERRGEHTMLTEMITEFFGGRNLKEALFSIYKGGAQTRSVASITRVVYEAVKKGDRIALELVKKNGRLMAEQTNALLRNLEVPQEVPVRVVGGCFKCHIAMFEAFKEAVLEEFPGKDIRPVIFEPVGGNILRHIYLTEGEVSCERMELVKKNFEPFLYRIRN